VPRSLTPFDTPRESIDWAAEAINELHAIDREFLGNENMRIVIEPHDKPQYQCLKVKALKPPPSRLRRKATEALNNLRHSFDQSLHAACVVLKEPRPYTNFPWRENLASVKGYLRSKDIPADLWDVIIGQEPYPTGEKYPGGDDFLYSVAQIANRKHTIGIRIVPQIRDTGQPNLEGRFILIPEPVWDPVKNEQIIAIGPSDMKATGHYTIILNIAFDESGPLRDQALAWGLAAFHSKAKKVADSLEARCIELLGI
jgi:hypothetical protein